MKDIAIQDTSVSSHLFLLSSKLSGTGYVSKLKLWQSALLWSSWTLNYVSNFLEAWDVCLHPSV